MNYTDKELIFRATTTRASSPRFKEAAAAGAVASDMSVINDGWPCRTTRKSITVFRLHAASRLLRFTFTSTGMAGFACFKFVKFATEAAPFNGAVGGATFVLRTVSPGLTRPSFESIFLQWSYTCCGVNFMNRTCRNQCDIRILKAHQNSNFRINNNIHLHATN